MREAAPLRAARARGCAIATAPRRLGAFALVGLTGIVVNEVALAIFTDLGLGTGLLRLAAGHAGVVAMELFVLTDRLVFRDARPARSRRTRLVAFMAMNNVGAARCAARCYLVLHKLASACTTWSRT